MSVPPPLPWTLPNRKRGVDVSSANGGATGGHLPWKAIVAAGVAWSDVKACDYSEQRGAPYEDPALLRHGGDADREGLDIGCYGFMHSTAPWQVQAEQYLRSRERLYAVIGRRLDIRPTLDLEDTKRIVTAPTLARDNALSWLDFVGTRTGDKPMIYTGKSVIDAFGKIDLTGYLAYDQWQARYRWDPNTGHDYGVVGPYEITIGGVIWPASAWQVGGNGAPRIDGVDEDLDIDVFFGDDPAYASWKSGDRPTPLPSTLPAPAEATDPRLDPHHGEGHTLAEDVHELDPPYKSPPSG